MEIDRSHVVQALRAGGRRDEPRRAEEVHRPGLEDGRARAAMMADYRAHADEAQGSPHFFLADGSAVHDPGTELHRDDAGYPVVDADDPSVHEDLVRRAADAAAGPGA